MNKIQSLFAATLAAISLNASAADWKMVSSTADEQTFIDSQSLIKGADNLIQVRVLENFSRTNNMGSGIYEHMSRYMLMSVDCQAGAVSHQQWSLQASALGTGATVWADNMQNGPAFFRPEDGSGYSQVVGTVCHAPVAMKN